MAKKTDALKGLGNFARKQGEKDKDKITKGQKGLKKQDKKKK